ncbi:DUF3089 domain-containing protein [Aeromicrobium sp. CTD01-1L150]|uniref:DUF3089 domain-containing protein n=1 Tax=Aeromicrobium sp. CTD01-1L150 TaxID=3341830 RepID=UPI0035BF8E87
MADDPCEIGLDTTLQGADGSDVVQEPERPEQGQRPVDCFYVYPTVSNQLTPNATATPEPEIRSIAKYQAARYSTQCRMFAPLYRQATLPGIALGPLGTARTAYLDVLAAWKQYLAEDNDGRGFVLIGHSQGTLMLRKLIQEEIDADPQVRGRLVGALLLGGNVTTAKGATTGGDFDNVPTCTEQGEAGCVVAYSTYASDPLPVSFFGNASFDPASAAFGLPPKAGSQVACTDPSVLSGSTEDVGVTVPSEPFATGPIYLGLVVSTYGQLPSADTTWVVPPDRYAGECRTINGVTIYRFDPVGAQSRRPPEFPPTWGTHLFDGNLGLDKLVSIVAQQSETWLAANA